MGAENQTVLNWSSKLYSRCTDTLFACKTASLVAGPAASTEVCHLVIYVYIHIHMCTFTYTHIHKAPRHFTRLHQNPGKQYESMSWLLGSWQGDSCLWKAKKIYVLEIPRQWLQAVNAGNTSELFLVPKQQKRKCWWEMPASNFILPLSNEKGQICFFETK